MTSHMGYLQAGGIVFQSIDIAFIRYSGIQKTNRFYAAHIMRVSCKGHLVFIHIAMKREEKHCTTRRKSTDRKDILLECAL